MHSIDTPPSSPVAPVAYIRAVLLGLLFAARPQTVAQDTLLSLANNALTSPLEVADLMEHLAWLRAHRLVGYATDPRHPSRLAARRWRIRPAGIDVLVR